MAKITDIEVPKIPLQLMKFLCLTSECKSDGQ